MARTVKTKSIRLEDELAGMSFVARTNPTMGEIAGLLSGDFILIAQAVSTLVLETFDFVDERGRPLPQIADCYNLDNDKRPSPLEVVNSYDMALTLAISRAIFQNVGQVDPN